MIHRNTDKGERTMNEYIATLNRDLIDYQRKTAHTAAVRQEMLEQAASIDRNLANLTAGSAEYMVAITAMSLLRTYAQKL